MRNILIAAIVCLLSACATAPGFQPGWLDKLPSRSFVVAAFVYPLQDARPFGQILRAPMSNADALRVEAALSRHITDALRARGFEVSSSIAKLRSEHVWLWDQSKGLGAEPTPSQLFSSTSPTHAQRVTSYTSRLKEELGSHPRSTVLITCVAAHLNNRDGATEYQVPVYMHFGGAEGISTERCGTTATVVALDDQLRLLAFSPIYTGHGAEVLRSSSNPLSSAFTFRKLSPEEWGEKIAKAVLQRLLATQ